MNPPPPRRLSAVSARAFSACAISLSSVRPAAVLFALALLAPVAPAVAQSDTTFVSTLGQPLASVGAITASGGRAQQFTAGDAAVALSAITVDIGTASATALPDVDLYTTAGDRPGAKVVDLNGSVTSAGEASFVPASATTLSASTEYFIVFRGTGGNYGVRNTSSNTVDAGFSAGWEIANTSLVSNDNGGTWVDNANTLKIALKGTDTVPVTLPTLRIGDATGNDAPVEGSAGLFTVTLSAASAQTVTVDWTASATGAGGDSVEAEPSDLTGTLSGTLTFIAGDTARTIAVATADDTTDEHRETFTVVLSGAVNATVADGEATGEILDNDPLPVAGVADASADEGSPIVFTVTLSPASERTATVLWHHFGGQRLGEDLTGPSSGTLTFAAGDTTHTFAVETVDDTRDEDDETFLITISSFTAGVSGTGGATGTILDNDDPPTVSVEDVSGVENSNIVFTATLSEESEKTISLRYNVAPQSAYDAVQPDYSFDFPNRPDRRVLTFNPGVTEQTFGVYALPDTIHEGDETFTVTLSDFVNVDPGDPTAQGTILDDDPPPVLVLAVSPARISEEGATATVTVSTGTGSTFETDQTIDLALSGPAVVDIDYTIGSTTLTLPAGNIGIFDPSTVTTTVTGQSDALDEDDETVLIDASRGGVDFGSQQTITLVDDDPEPMLSVAPARADEGGPMTFTVSLSAVSGKTVTVDYATADGTATTLATAPGGADYTAASGTLAFTPGTRTQTVTVATRQDTTDEDDETLTLTLTNATNAALTGGSTGTGTIDNNDTAPSLGVEDVSADEGGPLTFTVELAAVSGKTVRVDYATADGTATTLATAPGGADYTARSGTLAFTPGTRTQTVTVTTRQDTTDEDDETLTLTLSNEVNASLPADPTATATITDNDDPPMMSVSDADALEGDDIVFTVRLSAVSGKTVAVSVATNIETGDTAAAGGDFTPVSATTLTFAPGETEKMVTVTTTEDETDEDDETLTLTLSNEVNASLPADPTATGTIRNDEDDPTVTLGLTPAQIPESDDPAAPGDQHVSTVTATLSHASATPTTVVVSALAVSPALPADFALTANLELTIPANTTTSTGTVTLTALDNDTDAPAKQVRVSATATNPLGIVPPGEVVLAIADDEDAPTLTLTLSQASIGEDGGSATVTATLNHRSSQATTVTIAPSASDFTLSDSGSITIPAGATDGSGTVTLTAVNNPVDAPDKQLTVNATAVNTQGIEQPAGVALTIIDDEAAPTVTLTLSQASIGEDGGSATVSASLSHPSSEATTVTVTAAGADPLAAAFTLSGATLTVPAGQTAATGMATITATDNNTDAPDQVVIIDATVENAHGINPDVFDLSLEIPDDEVAPTVTLVLSANPIPEENGETTVTAMLSHPSSQATTVTVTAAAVAPALAADFMQAGGPVLTIAAGDEASDGAVTLTAVPNRVDAPDKTVRVSATAANTQGVAGPPAAVEVTVTDDDERGFAWVPTELTLSDADADPRPFTVALTSEPTATVTVTLHTSNIIKLRLFRNDTYPDSLVLTFTPQNWETPQSLALQALHDADAANDTLSIRHTAAGGDYAGLVQDYTVIVLDSTNPATGVRLTVDRPRIGEGNGATQVTVQATTEGTPLTSAVSVTVTVAPGTASATDYTASPASFTLTIPPNGSSASQSFTLTPVADGVDEDDETVSITGTTTATVENGTDPLTVSAAEVVIADDDTRGVTTSTLELAVDENASATYTVVLDSEPTGDVTVALAAAGDSDVTVAPLSLTFTATNWSAPQTVTVSAADDDDTADDRATVSHTVSEADYGANNVTAAPVAVRAHDDDAVGVTVSERALTVLEGDSATYTVVLDAQPSGTVTVSPSLAAGSDRDVTVSPSRLRFTATNWSAPLTVTVRAREDNDSADDRATVSHRVSGATGLAARDVEVTVTDNDQASTGIVLTVSPETVDERRGRQTVTVTATLNGAPLAVDTVVSVLVRGGTAAVTDFAADPAALPVTIRAGQRAGTGRFRLTPVNDDEDEGTGETVTVSGTAPSSALPVTAAVVTIADDDARGVRLSRTSLPVNEDSERTYTVALTSAPTGEVTMTLSVPDNPDVTVFPATLQFTAATWDTRRTVTVRAADDPDGDDDTATVRHAVSDADYTGMAPVDLPVTVDDNDQASRTVQLSLDPASVEEGAGSRTVRVTAVLDGAARAAATDVAVTVTGGSAVSGTDFSALGPITVTIPANATEASQTFTFAPVDDAVDEGLSETVILGGTAPSGLTVRTATLTIADDDGKGIELSPGPVTLTEEDADGRYTVALATQPTGEVTVRVTVSGNRDVTVDPSRLTFTASDWNQPQPVTVRAAHDDDAAADTAELRHAASGADYGGVSALPLAVAVSDNDRRGVTVSEETLTFREGGRATYTVVLDTQPSGTVTVTPSLAAGSDSDVTVSPSSLRFTTSNWKTPKTVTVRAGQDVDHDPDSATVEHRVSGADYDEAGTTARSVRVTVTDDDVPSTTIALRVSQDTVREGGGAQRLTVTAQLDGAPEAAAVEVTLSLEGIDFGTGATAGEDFAAAAPVTLTIPAGSTSATARVTITPVQDAIDEDDGETLRIAAATSSGLLLVPRSLEVTIVDDDTRGLRLSRTRLTVQEEGSATYTIRLASQPTANVVVIPRVPGDAGVTVETGNLVFTATDWNTAQTVTVRAAADPDGDDDTATVTHTAFGGDYDLSDIILPVTVDDNDQASRTVQLSLAPARVEEDGGSRQVTVTAVLDGAARAAATDVAVTVTGGSAVAGTDFSALGAVTVTIPANETGASQTFTFEPMDDDIDEGLSETVILGGTAPRLTVRTATLTVADDDTRGLVVEPQSVSLGEGGGTTLSVALASQPTGPVTVRISRTGSPEVTVTPASLAFAADTWNEPQVVAIEARRDEDDDVDEASLAFRASGADYGGVTAGPVTVTVAERGICYRTPQVRDVIMVRLGVLQNYRGVCADVTDEMLARLEYLTFHSDRVALTTLRAGDFAGLSGVRRIMLLDQPGLRVLPAGVFDGLEALQELWIGGSGIERIEAGAFRGLARLRRLDLADNRIEALAPGTFAGLLALQSLNLNRNRIPSFPLDELEALPNLDGLYTARNPGNVRGLRVSPTSLTVPRGGSASYRIGLTSAPQTPGAEVPGAEVPGAEVTVTEVTVTAPAGVTVAPYRVKFAYRHAWFRSQEVTVTVAPEAAQGTVTLVHEVSKRLPYGYFLTGEVPAVTLHIAGTASAPAGAALAGAAPAVAGMPAVTGPAGGEVYAAGDRIEARVAFDAPVTVDTAGGSPTLGLALGGVRREAAYEGGSGTAELVFALEVAAADAGAPAAHAIAHGLELGGATVRGADGTGAVLAFGAAPGVASVHIAPDAGGDGTWEAGEAVAVTLVFTEPVVVDTQDGTPSLRALVGAAEQVLAYAGGSGTSSLVFAHAVTEAGEPVAAVLVAQDALALHGGAIRSTAGLDVLLAHPGAGLAGVVRLALPELAVEDAHGPEGAPLRFRVTLSPAASAPVMVDYATADDTATAADTATAGEDYTAALGTLTFAAGQSARTIAVTVLDDGHDEGAETLTLTLSNPVGARIADGEATGTIVNSDPMPRAWLGRFGRTAWEHALGAVDERLRSARVPGPRATIAGRSIGVARSAADAAQAPRLAALAAWMESRDGEPEEPEVSVRELLAGSEFQVGIEPDAGGGVLTVWGHGAYGRFAGQEDDLAVSGDVASGTLGVDYAGGPWLAGLALSHSSGWGSYAQPHTAGGEVTSSLTGAYPYVRFAVVPQRLALWLAGGYGLGGLRLAPHGGTPLETRIGLLAGAAGVRATVVPAAASGGFSLAVNADGMLLRAASEATAGLAAAAAEVNRLRLRLEGSYALALGGGGRLTPSVEAALRRDGGDAETGFGMDAGGGLSYEHAALGLSLGLRGRALVVHETADLAEWGASGWLAWDPNPASELGPALTVSPSLGAPAHGGAAALWSRQTPAGLDTAAVLVAAGGRIDARFGYGLALLAGVGTPWVGIGLSEHDREYRLGYEFHAGWPPHTDLRVALEAMRRERAAAGAPEHGVTLRVTLRR